MTAEPTRTIEITDVIGGNETVSGETPTTRSGAAAESGDTRTNGSAAAYTMESHRPFEETEIKRPRGSQVSSIPDVDHATSIRLPRTAPGSGRSSCR